MKLTKFYLIHVVRRQTLTGGYDCLRIFRKTATKWLANVREQSTGETLKTITLTTILTSYRPTALSHLCERAVGWLRPITRAHCSAPG